MIAEPYRISRYPITVAQYSAFVKAGGYQDRTFWTEAGWTWRQAEEVDGPQTYESVYQTPNHPQVGVSWYEAIAFCRWLSIVLQTEITLPSEAQWERADRHTDGRIYPWGDQFDPQKCNMVNTGIGRTSAVGFFPSGNAACGASDMAGNVVELCRTKILLYSETYADEVDDDLSGDVERLWRGGCYHYTQSEVRCSFRGFPRPYYRGLSIGFRVVAPSL